MPKRARVECDRGGDRADPATPIPSPTLGPSPWVPKAACAETRALPSPPLGFSPHAPPPAPLDAGRPEPPLGFSPPGHLSAISPFLGRSSAPPQPEMSPNQPEDARPSDVPTVQRIFPEAVAPMVIEVFAGTARLSQSCQAMGFRTLAVDKSARRSRYAIHCLDLTQSDDVQALLDIIALEAGQLALVHLAPPCGTSSAAIWSVCRSPDRVCAKQWVPLCSGSFPIQRLNLPVRYVGKPFRHFINSKHMKAGSTSSLLQGERLATKLITRLTGCRPASSAGRNFRDGEVYSGTSGRIAARSFVQSQWQDQHWTELRRAPLWGPGTRPVSRRGELQLKWREVFSSR